jgi:hypothetical protein
MADRPPAVPHDTSGVHLVEEARPAVYLDKLYYASSRSGAPAILQHPDWPHLALIPVFASEGELRTILHRLRVGIEQVTQIKDAEGLRELLGQMLGGRYRFVHRLRFRPEGGMTFEVLEEPVPDPTRVQVKKLPIPEGGL